MDVAHSVAIHLFGSTSMIHSTLIRKRLPQTLNWSLSTATKTKTSGFKTKTLKMRFETVSRPGQLKTGFETSRDRDPWLHFSGLAFSFLLTPRLSSSDSKGTYFLARKSAHLENILITRQDQGAPYFVYINHKF